MESNKRCDLHEGRGRVARGQGQRGGRGRGEVERLRGSRERGMSRRPSEFDLGGQESEREEQGRSGRGQRHRGARGRGRGEVAQKVMTREYSATMRSTEPDLGEMCNKISEVMKERLESVVGNTREEMQTNMKAGMRVLVEAVEEVMDSHLGRVKAVEETMSRISERLWHESDKRRYMEKRTEDRLAEVENKVQEARTEVGKESSERKDVEKRTEVRLAEIKDELREARAEVGKESFERKDVEKRTDERLAELEDKVQEVKAEVDKLKDLRNKISLGESVKEMEAKVRISMCMVKAVNINIGMMTDNKATIVREALREVRKRTRLEETEHVNRVLKRTRLVVLGKKTERRLDRGRAVCTVPILFECQDRKDAQEIERTLRVAGYFPSFHWPSDIMEFIRNIREKVRQLGNTEQGSYIRIRPEVREGTILIRADAKPKVGGGYVMKGTWRCPPLNHMLWEGVEGLYTPQVVGKGYMEYN